MTDLVTIAPGHQLAPAPAASALRMFAAGCPASITSSYRSSARQAELRALYLAGKGAFALPPGSSLHERGEAVDWKRDAAEWVRDHPEYGWRFTNPDEWWHTDYILALDRTLHTLTPPTPITPTWEDDMALSEEARLQIRADVLEQTTKVIRAEVTSDAFVNRLAAAVLAAKVSPETGTLAQTTRDARMIARRVETAVTGA